MSAASGSFVGFPRDLASKTLDLAKRAGITDYETAQLAAEVESRVSDIMNSPVVERGFLVGKKTPHLQHVVAVFNTRDMAVEWAKSANRWYGEDHPITPLIVWPEDAILNPPLFPEPNGSVEDIFKDIDK